VLVEAGILGRQDSLADVDGNVGDVEDGPAPVLSRELGDDAPVGGQDGGGDGQGVEVGDDRRQG
jgi:hypothetical protein